VAFPEFPPSLLSPIGHSHIQNRCLLPIHYVLQVPPEVVLFLQLEQCEQILYDSRLLTKRQVLFSVIM
jgi:hypothetical protein